MAALVAIAEPALDRRAKTRGTTAATNRVAKYFQNSERRGRLPPRRPDKEDCAPATDI